MFVVASSRSNTRYRRLTIYLFATCFFLGGFILKVLYGFDRADETKGVGDRIVTIAQWAYGYGPDTWIVSDSTISVCRAKNGATAAFPIDQDMAVLIRGEAAKVPECVRGTYTSNSSVDGLNVEVEFTPDGKYRHDQIAANDVFMKELEPLFALINDQLPKEHQITYNSEMRRMHKDGYLYVSRMSQSDFNRRNSRLLGGPPIAEIALPLDEIDPKVVPDLKRTLPSGL